MEVSEALLLLEKLITIALLFTLVIKSNAIQNEVRGHTRMDDTQHKNLQNQLASVSRKIEDVAKDVVVMKERRQ